MTWSFHVLLAIYKNICIYIYIYIRLTPKRRSKHQQKKKTAVNTTMIHWTWNFIQNGVLEQNKFPRKFIVLFKLWKIFVKYDTNSARFEYKICSIRCTDDNLKYHNECHFRFNHIFTIVSQHSLWCWVIHSSIHSLTHSLFGLSFALDFWFWLWSQHYSVAFVLWYYINFIHNTDEQS